MVPPTHVTGAGWSFASAAQTPGFWTYTFLFVGNVPTSRSTTELDYRVPLRSAAAGTIAITGTAFAAGASAVSAASWKVK